MLFVQHWWISVVATTESTEAKYQCRFLKNAIKKELGGGVSKQYQYPKCLFPSMETGSW